ncbi:polyprenyl synthetase family protein [Coriobacterium glomerans]|uniref:polyprenyl synthetase family protein n=1 Tax=Coriobacterium glomerans TaxID=33871 RepID=UPI000317431A|nr:polyprenyl synthetase family protein [Coriobacterium glomerans]
MSTSFADFLAAEHQDLERRIADFFCDRTDRADIDAYLYAPLARFSRNGGKRHRPLICMLAARAVGGDAAAALDVATAIEHFQSAALIHDDIADRGNTRRGAPCLHVTEGEGIAINCGDLELISMTAAVLDDANLGDELKIRLLRELVEMTRRTIEGQALDLGWARDARYDLTVEDYLDMATRKTAWYSGAVPLACGAIAGGGCEVQVEGLRSFGLACGLAFQIQDDLINLQPLDGGGKDVRSDITQGKRTLICVHALLDDAYHDELVDILESASTDPAVLERAVEIFRQTNSIAFASERAVELIAHAKRALAGIELDAECRRLFISMADFFIERVS